MMTAEQILADIKSHNACPEGIEWATGMDSEQAWSTNDPIGSVYLFWWVVKNADKSGLGNNY
jgi:hypothetical protein